MGVSPLPRRWASRGGREQRSAKASLGLSSELHSWGLQALRRGEQVATGGSKDPRLGSFFLLFFTHNFFFSASDGTRASKPPLLCAPLHFSPLSSTNATLCSASMHATHTLAVTHARGRRRSHSRLTRLPRWRFDSRSHTRFKSEHVHGHVKPDALVRQSPPPRLLPERAVWR